MKDVTTGENPWLRGHWLDRLPGIDKDVDRMGKVLEGVQPNSSRAEAAIAAVNACLTPVKRLETKCTHQQSKTFTQGSALSLQLNFGKMPASVKLCYRRVNMAERYQTVEMQATGNTYIASIPEEYTRSPYPLAYYFEVADSPASVTLYPGFNEMRNNQPYFVVRQA